MSELLNKKELASEDHPINILMKEHSILLSKAEELFKTTETISEEYSIDKNGVDKIKIIIGHFKHSSSHYLREENVLFPYLEKHGITQPPAMMWREHDTIRGVEKNIYELLDNFNISEYTKWISDFKNEASSLKEILSTHFYKENNILFPTSLKLFTKDEWNDIRRQFDEIGYCSFTPDIIKAQVTEDKRISSKEKNGDKLYFPTGNLTPEQIESILNTIPFEITFIDKNEIVQYFNQKRDMIFVRTPAVIGREVRKCHPEKSLHLINKIIDEFKNRSRNVAEFWLTIKDRFIYIRYYPVFNNMDEYIGCVEVTQDITDTKKLEGEKRLL